MNPIFKDIYDSVVELTGKRNSPELITTEIALVTLEEHGARNYHKDYQTLSWMVGDDDEAYALNPSQVEPCPDKFIISLDMGSVDTLKVWTQSYEWDITKGLVNDPRIFIKGSNAPQGIHVIHTGTKVKIRSTSEPILAYEFKDRVPIDVTPTGYNSWIGAGLYKSVIIHEVAYRLQFAIGDSAANDNRNIAERSRRMLRTTEHYY